MAPLPAPAEILSAYAFAVPDDGADPYLRRGTHIRTYTGLGSSFAITPLIVRSLQHEGWRPVCQFYAVDPDGNAVPSGDLGQAEYLKLHLVYRDPDNRKTTSISVHSDRGDGAIAAVALLDQTDRVIGVKRSPPYTFAAPTLHKLKVWGTGVVEVQRTLMPLGMAVELSGDGESVLATLGLPVNETMPWYLGLEDRDVALGRVKDGAPKQLNPMDRPFGTLDELDHGDELDRVIAAMDTLEVDGRLDGLIQRMVGDEKLPPWRQIESMNHMGPTKTGKPQFASISRQGVLQMAAVDPGIARYLGYASRLDRLPSDGYDALSLFGLFAVSIKDFERYGLKLEHLAQFTATDWQIQAYATALQAIGIDRAQDIEVLAQSVLDRGFAIAPMETVIEACDPWLPPEVSRVEIFQKHWQPIDPEDGIPSRYYRATFAFPDMPMVSQAGLARLGDDDVWLGRNERLADPDRALPGIFGVEVDPAIRATELGLGNYSLKSLPLLADHDIDGKRERSTFAVWGSDMFGRFPDDGLKFDIETPTRPASPKPVLRFQFVRSPGEIGVGQSPGTLTITVAIGQPLPGPAFDNYLALGDAVVVPRLDDLVAGSLDIARLEVGIDNFDRDQDVSQPGRFVVEVDVPALVEGQDTTTYRIVGRYTDNVGKQSEVSEAFFTVRNFKAPTLLDTGVGLIWTSDPGPSLETEVKIKWPSIPGNQYRVYLADQAGMGIRPDEIDEQGPVPSRGLIAKVGATKEGTKKHFRLLTDPPLVATGETTVFTAALPRSLETVQFLRVVPLGSDGDEADFARCGIVAVAVPSSRRPAPPSLVANVDIASGIAKLEVSTDADMIALNRDEPGLFQPAAAGKDPPRAVIRRAAAGVTDPIYARQVGEPVAMAFDAATGRFVASIEDTNDGRGLEPYVRYVYWAEWQMPPERRLPAKVTEVHVGQIEAVSPSSTNDRPQPFSFPSAPRGVMRVPAEAPEAPLPDKVAVSVAAGPLPGTSTVTVRMVDPPAAHKKAIDRYRLAIWTQWQNKEIEVIRNANGVELEGTLPDIETGEITTVVAGKPEDVALTLRVALVDPIGRFSTLTVKPGP